MRFRKCEEIPLHCTVTVMKNMRWEPEPSGVGQVNNFTLILVTGQYCPLLSLNTGPSVSPTAGIISGTFISWCCPASCVIQRYPWIVIPLTGVPETQLLSIVMTTERKFQPILHLAKLCYRKKLYGLWKVLLTFHYISWIIRIWELLLCESSAHHVGVVRFYVNICIVLLGIVTMWSPNVREPLSKMLCHQHPLQSLAIDSKGL